MIDRIKNPWLRRSAVAAVTPLFVLIGFACAVIAGVLEGASGIAENVRNDFEDTAKAVAIAWKGQQ